MTILSDKSRRTLIDDYVSKGVPSERASIIVDLAAQACDQAGEAFMRAIKAAPDTLCGMGATELGSQLVTIQMKNVLAGVGLFAEILGGKRSDKPVEVEL